MSEENEKIKSTITTYDDKRGRRGDNYANILDCFTSNNARHQQMLDDAEMQKQALVNARNRQYMDTIYGKEISHIDYGILQRIRRAEQLVQSQLKKKAQLEEIEKLVEENKNSVTQGIKRRRNIRL